MLSPLFPCLGVLIAVRGTSAARRERLCQHSGGSYPYVEKEDGDPDHDAIWTRRAQRTAYLQSPYFGDYT